MLFRLIPNMLITCILVWIQIIINISQEVQRQFEIKHIYDNSKTFFSENSFFVEFRGTSNL